MGPGGRLDMPDFNTFDHHLGEATTAKTVKKKLFGNNITFTNQFKSIYY